jgi:predicted RNA methylase
VDPTQAERADLLTEAVAEAIGSHPRGERLDRIEAMAVAYDRIRRAVDRNPSIAAWFTPPEAVERLVAHAMARNPGTGWTACDPACGTGHILVGVARALGRMGWDRTRVAAAVHGMDLDPMAVAIARVRLSLVAGGTPRQWARRIRPGDALDAEAWGDRRFEAVIGNPPFLGQLAATSARTADARRARAERFGGAVRRYADEATAFLLLGCRLAPAGTVSMLQPRSTMAAQDALAVRQACEATHALVAVETVPDRTFDADVQTVIVALCAARPRPRAVLAIGEAGQVHRLGRGRLRGGAWSAALAAVHGVPDVPLRGDGTLGAIAEAGADFRQHYYGLRGRIHEAPAGGPGAADRKLVTVGAIGCATLHWGDAPVRIHGRAWKAPVVRPSQCTGDRVLAPWCASRSGPKLVMATQTRVPEGWVDADGTVLPSVPVITVRARDGRAPWKAAAALLSPPVAAECWWRHAGAGMSANALRIGPRQLMDLPAPADHGAWHTGAACLRRWQAANDPRARARHARRFAEAMCDAYRIRPADRRTLLEWWLPLATG